MSEHQMYLHMMFLCLNVLSHKVLKLHQVVNHPLYIHTHISGISSVTNNKCVKVSSCKTLW